MKELKIATTQKRQVLDITADVASAISELGVKDGVCHLFLKHTTASLTTADLDPGTDLDILDAFDAMVPKLKYRHPHDPSHAGDHILSALIGAALTVPMENGGLVLGEWQRVVLVEFDGPRERNVTVSVVVSKQ